MTDISPVVVTVVNDQPIGVVYVSGSRFPIGRRIQLNENGRHSCGYLVHETASMLPRRGHVIMPDPNGSLAEEHERVGDLRKMEQPWQQFIKMSDLQEYQRLVHKTQLVSLLKKPEHPWEPVIYVSDLQAFQRVVLREKLASLLKKPEDMVPNKGKQAPRKGNGKPKEQAKATISKQNVATKKEPDAVEIKENTLTFPLLKTVDNGRLMPRYTSIINRSEEEGVRFEDLDILKIELKGLLANVSVRVRVLQGELKNLANAADDKKDKKRQLLDKAPASPAKRGKYDDKPIKKVKETPVRGREPICSPPSIKITRVKSITVHGPLPPTAALPPEPEPPRVITPRNDNPSKFWQSLEQYCGEITSMDMKYLEESIRCRERGPDIAPIPPVGEFFASRWAKEDLRMEQEASSSVTEKKAVPGTSNLVGKKITPKPSADAPFTQRLVSALIEENVPNSKEKADLSVCKDGENITPLKVNKTISNSANLEKFVIKELEDQGFLEKDTQVKNTQNDEIMKEILRVQSEVTAITAHNCKMLKHILHMAKDQLPNQELKKKLDMIDNEIRDIYRKFSSAKLKKRVPSKREREQAWRVLKERDFYVRQLYGFPARTVRGIIRPPQATQVRPPPEKVNVLKPPMGKGPVDKSRLAMQEKQTAERQSIEKPHTERQPLEKPSLEKLPILEKTKQGKPRTENIPFIKPCSVPLVKPPLDNPPMDCMMP